MTKVWNTISVVSITEEGQSGKNEYPDHHDKWIDTLQEEPGGLQHDRAAPSKETLTDRG